MEQMLLPEAVTIVPGIICYPLDLSLNYNGRGKAGPKERYFPDDEALFARAFEIRSREDHLDSSSRGTNSSDEEITVTDDIPNGDISMTSKGITMSLQESGLWRAFNDLGTEMIINRCGRRMFPHLVVKCSGIEPSGIYKLMLEINAADDRRYKYVNNNWTPMGMADPERQNLPFFHSEGFEKGSALLDKRASFAKLKLTNNRESSNGNIVLYSMHKYIPKITLIKFRDNRKDIEMQYVFSFPETAFIAVTAYQNDRITKLKILSNPFAKAFRDGRGVKIKASDPENATTQLRRQRENKEGPAIKRRFSKPDIDINDKMIEQSDNGSQCCVNSRSTKQFYGRMPSTDPKDEAVYSLWSFHQSNFHTPPYLPYEMKYQMSQLPLWFPYYPFFKQDLPRISQDQSSNDSSD